MFASIRFIWKKYDSVRYNKDKFLKEFFLNDQGEAVVFVQLEDFNQGISRFSIPDYEIVNEELADYIDRMIYHIPLKYSIQLRILSKHLNEKEKQKLSKMLYDHYGLMLEDKRQDLKINLLIIWALFGIGVVFLSLSYFLAAHGKGQLITDTINIAGTFALWEMVDLYLLDRKAKKVAIKNVAQTYLAKHIFIPMDKSRTL